MNLEILEKIGTPEQVEAYKKKRVYGVDSDVIEKAAAYYEKIRKPDEAFSTDSLLRNAFAQIQQVENNRRNAVKIKPICTLDDAKKIMWSAICAVNADHSEAEIREAIKGKEDLISLLAAYVARIETENGLDCRKGLFFYGSIGSGKTRLAQAVFLAQRALLNINVQFETAMSVMEKAGDFFSEYSACTPYCFDDIGFCNMFLKSYGNNIKPFDVILLRRYDAYMANRSAVTHITTNFELNELPNHFEPRVLSRLRQMMNFIEIAGSDLRKK